MVAKRAHLAFLFIVVFLLLEKAVAQKVEPLKDTRGEDPDEVHGYIVPETIRENVDKFRYQGHEYLFVGSMTFNFEHAFWVCRNVFQAHLGYVKTSDVAYFLAEALSETNLDMDTMWVAARRYHVPHQDNESSWYWMERYNTTGEQIPNNLVHLFRVSPGIIAEDRDCLGFGRLDHDQPDYRPLTCRAQRYSMCERREDDPSGGNSTHRGWIRLGTREYKIFSELVTYTQAKSKCFEADANARLAVIVSFDHSQKLGRYLLIGRPSLENGWIGAKWKLDHYTFEPEPIPLSNKSDAKGYPPWRNNKIKKTDGCVLLDRHISNITLFIEARCERLRPYICYRPIVNKTDEFNFTDIIIGDDGYRLYYMQRSWNEALNYCKEKYAKYGAILVEIPTKKRVSHLLYVMGENKTAVQHIWVAGKFDSSQNPPVWVWASNNAKIPTDGSVLNWIKNDTYQDNVEKINDCLDMDRENHITALHYGTDCEAQQSFVCYFTAANLRKLQEDEAKARNNTLW